VPSRETGISVNELCVAFLRHADQHYRKGGKRTAEYDCFVSAIRPLKELFGVVPVGEFGPCALKTVRQKMVEKGWCRRYVNKSTARIRRVFKFGVENETVEPTVLQKLQAVAPLLAGRMSAPDHPPRQPDSAEHIAAVKKVVSVRCGDLIDLQLLTGARSGELLMLTGKMIDRSGEIWMAELRDHKTQHHGKVRKLVFGPQAQLTLRRLLRADPNARLFAIRRDYCGHAVAKACDMLKIPRWTPHWLQHNVATRIRDEFGIEAAQAMAGQAM
jgi:integrase